MQAKAQKIHDRFKVILDRRREEDTTRIASQSPGVDNPGRDMNKLAVAGTIKDEILREMAEAVEVMGRKKEITSDQAGNARTAIGFYGTEVDVTPPNPAWTPNPHAILSEVVAIDYSKEVKVETLKYAHNRFLTQMQAPHGSIGGNFFGPGTVPANYFERADASGIGLQAGRPITDEDERALRNMVEAQERDHKSVYVVQFKYDPMSSEQTPVKFLKSTASPCNDTWSARDDEGAVHPQLAQGGGLQLRISTAGRTFIDYENAHEFRAEHAPRRDFHLKKGETHAGREMERKERQRQDRGGHQKG